MSLYGIKVIKGKNKVGSGGGICFKSGLASARPELRLVTGNGDAGGAEEGVEPFGVIIGRSDRRDIA